VKSFSFRELVLRRYRIKSELENFLSHESIKRAINDYHARRPPRPCGLTVHSAVGCPLRCNYCYIQDMGFDFIQARPYALRGVELAYALISNKYFIPGLEGTYLPFGSISEPFLSNVIDRTLEYMTHISRYLGNPMQFSTKMFLSEAIVRRLKSIDAPISPLITIVATRTSKILEPNAPPVSRRLESIRVLRAHGFYPILFLRPLIPGVSLEEIEEVIEVSKEAGAIGVVVGNLRVTQTILSRLKRAGFNLSELLKVIPRTLKEGQQLSIAYSLKDEVLRLAKEKGLIALKSACCANALNIFLSKGVRVPCANVCYVEKVFCTNCPVECEKHIPDIELEDVSYGIRNLFKINNFSINITKRYIEIYLPSKSLRNRLRAKGHLLRMLSTLYRRKIILKVGGSCCRTPVEFITDITYK